MPTCCVDRYQPRRGKAPIWLAVVVTLFSTPQHFTFAQSVEFDFRQPEVSARWTERHDISRALATAAGLRLEFDRPDPYIVGPPADYPAGLPLLARFRVRSTVGGEGQLFYFQQATSERNSVRFAVEAGDWRDVGVQLPPLGPGYRLRLDPPGRRGAFEIERLSIAPRVTVDPPAWPKPAAPDLSGQSPSVASGRLCLRQSSHQWGGFEVRLDERLLATGHNRPLVGYVKAGQARWIDVAAAGTATARQDQREIAVAAEWADADGGHWRCEQTFAPTAASGTDAIDVRTTVTVDSPRDVVWLPLLLLLPGHTTTGERKSQALFAGVEYLDDEPSSSTADIEGPLALRRVPEAAKITFPLMAVHHAGDYVGLIWQPARDVAALFDSPDRTLGSGAHLLGLVAPGSDGVGRVDGAVLPHEPLALVPGQPLVQQATIIAGAGESVVPAVQAYVKLRGLPPLPPLDRAAYLRQAAVGWLDTPIRQGGRFRHAVAGNSFAPQPALDAAWMMQQLAGLVGDEPLARRLNAAAAEAAALVEPGQLLTARVGHIHQPLGGLLGGRTEESLEQARQIARGQLARFESDGSLPYRAAPGRPDYARTHWSREANGLASDVVARTLSLAVYSGDRALVEQALARLADLARFDRGVPRGAQTWEVPLHTPDVLAAAHLVGAYTLAHAISGDRRWLDRALYWAWTGVPFVYLQPPTGGPVGLYATTPVLGATDWVAPVWIGKPVQWCGLVYAESLHRLARFDPAGPWRQLADGIAASGIQQSYPLGEPHQGLLPDSFNLKSQSRNPADINPGTLQPLALALVADVESYDFVVSPRRKLWLHAAGRVVNLADEPDRVAFEYAGWPRSGADVLIHGLAALPTVAVDGRREEPGERVRFVPETGSLILRLSPGAKVELTGLVR